MKHAQTKRLTWQDTCIPSLWFRQKFFLNIPKYIIYLRHSLKHCTFHFLNFIKGLSFVSQLFAILYMLLRLSILQGCLSLHKHVCKCHLQAFDFQATQSTLITRLVVKYFRWHIWRKKKLAVKIGHLQQTFTFWYITLITLIRLCRMANKIRILKSKVSYSDKKHFFWKGLKYDSNPTNVFRIKEARIFFAIPRNSQVTVCCKGLLISADCEIKRANLCL